MAPVTCAPQISRRGHRSRELHPDTEPSRLGAVRHSTRSSPWAAERYRGMVSSRDLVSCRSSGILTGPVRFHEVPLQNQLLSAAAYPVGHSASRALSIAAAASISESPAVANDSQAWSVVNGS